MQRTTRTKGTMPRLAAAALAAGLAGLAAAQAMRTDSQPAPREAPAAAGDPSLFDIIALHRWGYGALEGHPTDRGDQDERCNPRRRC